MANEDGRITAEEMATLRFQVAQTIDDEMSSEVARYWINNPDLLEKGVRKFLSTAHLSSPSLQFELRAWTAFYKKYFGWDLDFSSLVIPSKPVSKNKKIRYRLLIVVDQLTIDLILDSLPFDSVSITPYTDWTDRHDTKGIYAVWVVDSRVPNSEFGKSSTFSVLTKKLRTETCIERFLHGLKYYDETNQQIDWNTKTVCMGTLCGAKGFPVICFRDHKLLVNVFTKDAFPRGTGIREVFP